MTDALAVLAAARHGCGQAYTAVRDRGFSVTRTTVFERELAGDSSVSLAGPATFRFGTADDLMSLTQKTHDYGPAEKRFGLERLEQGDSLVLGEWDGALVFYGWLMYGQMDLDQNVPLPTVPDAAYSYKLFTVPQARGLRICAGYYSFVESWLEQRGYGRLICRISPGNDPSIRGHLRVGFRPCGTLWKLVALRQAYYFADESMRSWLGSLSPEGRLAGWGFLRRHRWERQEL